MVLTLIFNLQNVLQEASSLKDPFTAHMLAPEKAEAVEVDTQLEQELQAERPSHDRLEKLISLKVSVCFLLLGRTEAAWMSSCPAGLLLLLCTCAGMLPAAQLQQQRAEW